MIRTAAGPAGLLCLEADDGEMHLDARMPAGCRLGPRWLLAAADAASVLATDNETNGPAVYGPEHVSRSQFTKDAFHRFLCNRERSAVNAAGSGTKVCIQRRWVVPPGGSVAMHLVLTDRPPPKAVADERHVQRRALAGLLWSKQNYIFDVEKWLDGDNPAAPPPASRQTIRNQHWRHLNSLRVLSMPDAWEYPWFAAWDLAFQCIPFALVDTQFAKDQLWFLLFEQFQHPSGQLPAYEWELSDLNPPVHAWAVWRVYNMEQRLHGRKDRAWLERCYHKLLLNFTSWVNKVDREGHNVFEGEFLGLDNISIFDRSEQLEDGAALEQSDATGWMGMFSLIMMRISLELPRKTPSTRAWRRSSCSTTPTSLMR